MYPMKYLERRSLRLLAQAALCSFAAFAVHAQDTASPAATAGEELFVVTLSNPNGNLNVRKEARANSDAVGRFANGTVVRNTGGCQRQESSSWCEVEAQAGGLRGWVSEKYLTPATRETIAAGSEPAERPAEPVAAEDPTPVALPLPAETPAAAPDIPGDTDDGPAETKDVVLAAGVPSAALDGVLKPGASARYILTAKDGQSLEVAVLPYGPGLSYRILNADGSLLQDQVDAAQSFLGQIDRSGDLVIEVTNASEYPTTYMFVYAVN